MASEEEAGLSGASRSMGLAASAVLSAKSLWPVRLVCRSTSCKHAPAESANRTHTRPKSDREPRGATKSDGGVGERGELREGRAGSYGLGAAWLAAVGADEVEDGLGGLDEVGVVGDLGVRLRLLHAPQLRATVAAPQRQPRHCRRRFDRLEFGSSPQQIWGGNSEQTKSVLSPLLARFLGA